MFVEQLRKSWASSGSLLCIGLDPDLDRLPRHFRHRQAALFEFNREIIDATADLVCAFKPQVAFYSAQTAETQLLMTVEYIKRKYPHIPVILDAKRGDVGHVAHMYAREAFDRFKADAVTVNPYFGTDGVMPFLQRPEKGAVLVCRTSNPGAIDFQDLTSGGKRLYTVIAQKARSEWNANKNVMLVIGATYPKELREVREIVDDLPLLVPGVGLQGGDIASVITNGLDRHGAGLVLSASRSVIYASRDMDFAAAARKEAVRLRNEINRCRELQASASPELVYH